MEAVDVQPPTIYMLSYLRDAHCVVHTCEIFDIPSLCAAKKKELVVFIEVNCTPEDRGHLGLSSMCKTDLFRHATAILVPRGTALSHDIVARLSPYRGCSDAELILLATQRGLLEGQSKKPTEGTLLHMIIKSGHHEPVVLSATSEDTRRAITERCLDALKESFQGARYEEECRRFLDWTQRDAIAHEKADILLARIQWLRQLGIPCATETARYLSRCIVPFVLLRPDLILSNHGCLSVLHIDKKLQRIVIAKDQDRKGDRDGFFQRVKWIDDSQLREPQRLALEALRHHCAATRETAPTGSSTLEEEYKALMALRGWFGRILRATFLGRTPPLKEGERVFTLLQGLETKLSPLPRMVVLPTGVGKTGVMCLAPFTVLGSGEHKAPARRVLAVCPNVTIRQQMAASFTSFYGERVSLTESPRVLELDGSAMWDFCNNTHDRDHDVFVATFHKLTGNELLSRYPRSFFELILVDEAHHAEAHTYKLLREHFCNANFMYFTGTPYRCDRVALRAEIVYSCTMREALLHDPPYIKHLCYLPVPVSNLTQRSELTGEERNFASFADIEEHATEINGSLQLSFAAMGHLIGFAIWKLKQMRQASGVHHQALLQASDTSEAEFLAALWNAHPENKKGSPLSIAVIRSGMPPEEIHDAVGRLKALKLDAIVHVGMIGEGFDHPHLSICCLFKRFASMAPVVQLLGRVLRRIPGASAEDNCAYVIAHPALGFRSVWNAYKQELGIEAADAITTRGSNTASSRVWSDLEETCCYEDEVKHADWF